MIQFNSIRLIDVLSQQPEGQLQKQHRIYTVYRGNPKYEH